MNLVLITQIHIKKVIRERCQASKRGIWKLDLTFSAEIKVGTRARGFLC